MNNQYQEEKEYFDFIKELAEKSGELMGKYQKLSEENKRKVSSLCRKIVTTQGMAGIMRFIQNPFNF
jgi:hypothetical protein